MSWFARPNATRVACIAEERTRERVLFESLNEGELGEVRSLRRPYTRYVVSYIASRTWQIVQCLPGCVQGGAAHCGIASRRGVASRFCKSSAELFPSSEARAGDYWVARACAMGFFDIIYAQYAMFNVIYALRC